MEKRKWLWKRKSSEKSSCETESSGSISSRSEMFSDDQQEPLKGSPDHNTQSPEVSSKSVASNENVDESSMKSEDVNNGMKCLTEKLSAALVNVSAKEDLVKQHAKVAEEAVAGWEKAENEVATLKQQLEDAVQQKSALEDRASHLDGALKECVRQLRQARDEQEQKIQEAVSKKTREWESTKCKLENQLLELQNKAPSEKAESSARIDPDLCLKLEYLEKENSALRLEIEAQMEELEVRTIERDLSTQAAETASKQHLESIKKVAKLEAECRRFKAMACKSSTGNDNKSTAASSIYVESFTDSHSDNGEHLNAVDANMHKMNSLELNKCEQNLSDSWASALIAELDQFKNEKAFNKSLPNSSIEINLMDDFLEMERLAALQPTESRRSCLEPEIVARDSKNRESALRAELEAMVQRTAELEEKLEKLERERVELEAKEPNDRESVLRAELEDRIHQITNLEGKLEKLETEKAELKDQETALKTAKACRSELKLGRQIHGFAISSGFISHSIVSNSLMNMYSKSGQLESAFCVFASLCNPSIVAWNTILSGFRKSEEAFDFALRMNLNGVKFDSVSYTTILAFCSDYEEFLFGIQLHCLVIKSGFDCEVFVGNALVSVYSRCENLLDARRVFDEMPNKDLVTWNAMISGYTQDGDHGLEAVLFFLEMVRGRMELDHVSFTSAVSACGHEKNLELGKQIHGLVIKSGYGTHVSVCNVLISTYSKCEVIEDAKLVFWEMNERNVVSWTSMVSINEDDAMNLFHGMRLDGVYPNDVTFVGLIHAITTRNLVEEGQKIHGFCVKTSFLSEQNVCNSFITMYAKFQSIGDCLKFFEELRYRDITSWNSIISGCSQNGLYKKALHMFLIAVAECKPNHYTFGSALSAIADAPDISLKYGQRCHSYLIKHGLNTHLIISGALLDMYAKRGSICESQKVFDDTPQRSQFAWTALISAYASHGDYESMIKLFREMVREEVKPDSITFLSVLTACSRKGMVEMGRELFNSMVKNYKIEPSPEHFSCMVDLLGRAGKLEEAEEMLGRIPGQPGLSVLQSLLGACQMYGNLEMAERTAQALMALEPTESGPYVLVSNLYAEKGEWEKVAKIRRGMRNKGVKKVVGFSWVDVGDVGGGSLNLHGFSAGDKSHPKSEEIFRMAKYLGFEMRLLSEREDNECLQENFSNIEYLESGQNG